MVSFITAKFAKEIGFEDNSPKESYNQDGVLMPETRKHQGLPAPTQSDLQKWLREKHRVNVEVNWLPNIEKYRVLFTPMDEKPNKFKSTKEYFKNSLQYFSNVDFEIYEHALEYGLPHGLKQIKIKQINTDNEKKYNNY